VEEGVDTKKLEAQFLNGITRLGCFGVKPQKLFLKYTKIN
jgi:hypothetical protein